MGKSNIDIIVEIDRKIADIKSRVCGFSSNQKQKCLEDLEKLIELYQEEDEIDTRIKENRRNDLEQLRNICFGKPGGLKVREKQNRYTGIVKSINPEEYKKWIINNKIEINNNKDDIIRFTKKYPFVDGEIRNLSIDEYVMGKGAKSFCWHLENETPGNMGQRYAQFYHLFWSDEDKSYKAGFGEKSKVVTEETAKVIFGEIKSNIERVLMFVKEDNIEKIETFRVGLPLPVSNVLMKILFLYFPDKFFGYYSSEYIYKIAAILNINSSVDVFLTNNAIASKVKESMLDIDITDTDKTVGFTIYLWSSEWDDYLKKTVG